MSCRRYPKTSSKTVAYISTKTVADTNAIALTLAIGRYGNAGDRLRLSKTIGVKVTAKDLKHLFISSSSSLHQYLLKLP